MSSLIIILISHADDVRLSPRVVLMSATVDAEKISDFFGGCPTLSVPGRTFPVNTFFLEDAIEYSKWFINGESPYARRCASPSSFAFALTRSPIALS